MIFCSKPLPGRKFAPEGVARPGAPGDQEWSACQLAPCRRAAEQKRKRAHILIRELSSQNCGMWAGDGNSKDSIGFDPSLQDLLCTKPSSRHNKSLTKRVQEEKDVVIERHEIVDGQPEGRGDRLFLYPRPARGRVQVHLLLWACESELPSSRHLKLNIKLQSCTKSVMKMLFSSLPLCFQQ